MLTVTKLARRFGLSRSTLLYYESIGLLEPEGRTGGNYRAYGDKHLERLRQICEYRAAGLTLDDIRTLLRRPDNDAASVLKRRLAALNDEIERLRAHQRAILKLLQSKQAIWRTQVITKEKWVSIMKASGFTEDDMHRWHAEFERMAPEEHGEFLQFLHIPDDEIRSIRQWSRTQPNPGAN
jgi:DNA-binding transcriptional MerR regulator